MLTGQSAGAGRQVHVCHLVIQLGQIGRYVGQNSWGRYAGMFVGQMAGVGLGGTCVSVGQMAGVGREVC